MRPPRTLGICTCNNCFVGSAISDFPIRQNLCGLFQDPGGLSRLGHALNASCECCGRKPLRKLLAMQLILEPA